jgi:ELWxxDGT repeat protein
MKRANLLAFLAFFCLGNLIAQLPYPKLLKDINPSFNNSHRFLGALNGDLLYFDGKNLKKTGGTPVSTVFIQEFSNPGSTVFADGKLFIVNDAVDLWETDGTSAGTQLIYHLQTWPGYNGEINNLYDFEGKLHFATFLYTGGASVIRYDGGNNFQTLFSTSYTSFFVSPKEFTNFNGKLAFVSTHNSTNNPNLYVDGMAVTYNFSPYDAPKNLVAVGDQLFFSWVSDQLNYNGFELCKVDGNTHTTSLVKEIYPGSNSGDPQNMMGYEGHLYFSANDGVHGYELWISDGTEPGTHRIVLPQTGTSLKSPYPLGIFNNELYLAADDGIHGMEIWKTDGNTFILAADVSLGPAGSNPQDFTPCGGQVFFAATADYGEELYKLDSTTGDFSLVKDIYPGTESSNITGMLSYNDEVYFNARWSSEVSAASKSDGTASGTHYFSTSNGQSSYPLYGTNINGTLFFTAQTHSNGPRDIWKSSGTTQSTRLAVNSTDGGVGSLNYLEFAELNGDTYFIAPNNAADEYLWKIEGTSTSPVQVKQINPINVVYYPPHKLMAMDGKLYFFTSENAGGMQLWSSDGTALGTQLVKHFTAQPYQSINILKVKVLDNKLFFTVYRSPKIQELWQSDGTTNGTTLFTNLTSWGLGFDNYPTDLNQFDSLIYFSAFDSIDFKKTLWRTNGTTSGTSLLKKFDTYLGNNYLHEMAKLNDQLFFSAYDSAHGDEIWYTNGSSNSTYLLKDISTGSTSSSPYGFTTAADKVFFIANTAAVGTELWVADGLTHHTKLLKDITPGPASSELRQMTPCNGQLIFSAYDPEHGWELWITDGTRPARTWSPIFRAMALSFSAAPTMSFISRRLTERTAKNFGACFSRRGRSRPMAQQ